MRGLPAPLVGLGYSGSERTTRRAVAAVKGDYRLGRVRVHRPWVTEPGMWLQYDFGDGPLIGGVKSTLFVAWLAWSRFRVVLAIRDKTAPSVMAALDVTLHRIELTKLSPVAILAEALGYSPATIERHAVDSAIGYVRYIAAVRGA
jgi:hypothetical protein